MPGKYKPATKQSTTIATEILYARDRWKWRTVFLVLWSLLVLATAHASFNSWSKAPRQVDKVFVGTVDLSAEEIAERQKSIDDTCVILLVLVGVSLVITPSLIVRSATKPSSEEARKFGRRFTLTQLKCIRYEINKSRPISAFLGLLLVTAPVIIVDQYRFSSRARRIVNADKGVV